MVNPMWFRKETYEDLINFVQHDVKKIKMIKNRQKKEMANELLNCLNIHARNLNKIQNLIEKYKDLPNKQIRPNKRITKNRKNRVSFKELFFLENAKKEIKKINNSNIKERAKALLNDLKNTDFRTQTKIGNLYLIKNEYLNINLGEIKTYIGFSHDGTLVAVQCGFKNQENRLYFKNEFYNLNNTKLESRNIIKYVSLENDRNYIYLAVKLWDYCLDEYIKRLYQPDIDQQTNNQLKDVKQIVLEVLLGLQVLHQAGVIHGAINPRNITIDSDGNVRLIGFNRLKKEGETTVNIDAAGVHENDYTKSSDIKDAGMLVYYILSGGKHLVIEDFDMQNDVQDIVALDLIKLMIINNPTIDKVIKHPYLWDAKRKEEVIKKVGDRPEVQNYIDILKAVNKRKDEEGLTAIEAFETVKKGKEMRAKILSMLGKTEEVQNQKFVELSRLCEYSDIYTQGKTFNNWKSVLSDQLKPIAENSQEDLIGLLRTYRNKWSHV